MSAFLDTFLSLLRPIRDAKLAELDGPIRDALIDGSDMTSLRAQRRTLLDLPASIVDGDRAALVAQWPVDFPALPLWFTDPAAAAAADPPGPPCVVDCGGGE
jgi:hypothetical protein